MHPTNSNLTAGVEPRALPLFCEPGDEARAKSIADVISGAKKIVIGGHERPDGDCIGSEVALCAILRHAGFDAEIINADSPPPKYDFLVTGGLPPLPGCDVPVHVAGPDECIKTDVLIVLDAPELRRLGRIAPRIDATTIIVMDHHPASAEFGLINWIDTRACATGELVWRLAACRGWAVPRLGLQALYTAIITDTGQLSYSNTSPRALRMVAELVERGVDPEVIWQRIYLNKTAAELALESRARASLSCAAGGKICCISLSIADFAATGTGPQNTEEFVGIPRALNGVVLSVFMYEINKGAQTKISLRSTRQFDASALARTFGGGGHRQAAAFAFNGSLTQARAAFLPIAEAAIAAL